MTEINPSPSYPWRVTITTLSPHRPPRILVVDAKRETRTMIAETLHGTGYDVVEAADLATVLSVSARVFAPNPGGEVADLLITTTSEPVCAGIQMLARIRAADWRMPVLLMTAPRDEAPREDTAALGALLLDHPFDMHDLRIAGAHLLRVAAAQ